MHVSMIASLACLEVRHFDNYYFSDTSQNKVLLNLRETTYTRRRGKVISRIEKFVKVTKGVKQFNRVTESI